MPTSPRVRLGPILLEASFVVLGVFVALVANEWRADANARAHAAHARAGIVEEIAANRAAVAEAHAYHERLLDTLRTYFPPERPPPPPAVFDRGFVHAATLLRTAWDAANATDAVSHMDYDEVLAFSTLYAEQARYERAAQNAGSVIYSEIVEHGVPGVAENFRNLSYLIGANTYLEAELLAAYDEMLDALGEAP
ncbi:MAG: hypothetical protein R3181_15150 [Rubricoccaceae bacterium]|nr:hypothetical protein [Rubricoccaceae bacterium]